MLPVSRKKAHWPLPLDRALGTPRRPVGRFAAPQRLLSGISTPKAAHGLLSFLPQTPACLAPPRTPRNSRKTASLRDRMTHTVGRNHPTPYVEPQSDHYVACSSSFLSFHLIAPPTAGGASLPPRPLHSQFRLDLRDQPVPSRDRLPAGFVVARVLDRPRLDRFVHPAYHLDLRFRRHRRPFRLDHQSDHRHPPAKVNNLFDHCKHRLFHRSSLSVPFRPYTFNIRYSVSLSNANLRNSVIF